MSFFFQTLARILLSICVSKLYSLFSKILESLCPVGGGAPFRPPPFGYMTENNFFEIRIICYYLLSRCYLKSRRLFSKVLGS